MESRIHTNPIRRVGLALIAVLASVGCAIPAGAPSPLRTTAAITAGDAKTRIYIVADDSMRGREAGAAGNFTMTSYVAKEMERLGLEPGGENGTWFQTVPMIRRSADTTSTLIVNGQPLRIFSEFALVRPTSTVRFSAALPAATYSTIYGGRAGDSSFTLSAADVQNRIIVLDAPLNGNGQPTGVYTTAAAASIARYPGAAGLMISVIDIMSAATSNSLRSRGLGVQGNAPTRTPFGMVTSASAAEKIMGAPLATLKPGARGADIQANVRFIDGPVEAPARNVIAIVRGSDPALRNEYVAIGAHSDHIATATRAVDHDSLKAYNQVMRPNGADQRVANTAPITDEQLARVRSLRDSLRRVHAPRRDSIYNGADDDGSGSVAILEIAESLAGMPRPRRSILLVWHTGEESGLLGSAWFADHTTVPHDSIVAQLNMDMVGRGEKRDNPAGGPRYIQVMGSRRLSTDLGDVVDSVNAAKKTPYLIDYSFDAPRQVQNRYCRSDHYMYARTGIPIAYISRGYHSDYHMVTDEPQYISYQGLANVATFVRDIALAVANRNDRVRVDKPKPDPLAPCQQ
ncbi:MAG TPA: M28 family peptidase [Gemmatimonadaceae bacterium]|nr:M28 family peptidase [Gemmatimonadaceae bacterium]